MSLETNSLSLNVNNTSSEQLSQALFQLLSNNSKAQDTVAKFVWNSIKPFRDGSNAFFLISMAIQIHIMQCGFALLEAGCVRAKNATNSMWKNCVCGFIAALGFWICGFALAFGKSLAGVIGSTNWVFLDMKGDPNEPNNANFWFFQYSFCTTAATIISGAIAERAHISVFLVSSFIMSAFTYPLIVHWTWNEDGWLKMGSQYDVQHTGISSNYERVGFVDFAGSGVVHLTGGAASLAGLIVLGARHGRFLNAGDDKFEPLGHSTTLAALGCMILSTEFVAFNSGSQMRIDGKTDDGLSSSDEGPIGQAAVNTMLSGAAGMLSVTVFCYWKYRKFPMLPPLCGSLAGNVAICAGCNVFSSWAAIIVGFIAGLVYVLVSWSVVRCRLDDPVDAVGVHFGGGLTGLLALAFLDPKIGIFYKWDQRSALFFAWQLTGAVVIFCWAFLHTIAICFLMKLLKIMRPSIPDEKIGMDIAHGHEEAYPAVSYCRTSKSDMTDNRVQINGNVGGSPMTVPYLNESAVGLSFRIQPTPNGNGTTPNA